MALNPLLTQTNNGLISGLPLVTSSFLSSSNATPTNPYIINFGWTTKTLVIRNIDPSSSLFVGFSSGCFGRGNYITISPQTQAGLDWTVNALYLSISGSFATCLYELVGNFCLGSDSAEFAPLSNSVGYHLGAPANGQNPVDPTTYPFV